MFLGDLKVKGDKMEETAQNNITLAKEERSSAIVDELKRNVADEKKAFFGYPFEFSIF